MTTEAPLFPVALALGSNVGDRLAHLKQAVEGIKAFVDVDAVSQVYETAPVYVTDQPVFLNAALRGKTALEPLPLLWKIKDLEKELGRAPTFRYGPRAIDIDILFLGDQLFSTPELTLPHSRLAERAFVLYPLNDIAPDWRHPVAQKTVAEMLSAFPSHDAVCLGKILS
jgi:2-amino-4-hydroxy-6-hydroxymethyldihydropteridine diphosphokinase